MGGSWSPACFPGGKRALIFVFFPLVPIMRPQTFPEPFTLGPCFSTQASLSSVLVEGKRGSVMRSFGRRLAITVSVLCFCPGVFSQARWEMEHDGLPNIVSGAMVTDLIRGKVVQFGGPFWYKYRQPRFSVVWEWNGKSWDALRDPSGPAWRDEHSMAYDWVNKGVLLYGGYKISFKSSSNGSTTLVNDTWVWNGRSWKNMKPKTLPTPVRGRAAMASNLSSKRMILFGGEASLNSSSALNDTWEWNGVTWKQIFPNTVPPARKGHSMTYDPLSNRILMFGGFGQWGRTPRKDLWAWDGRDWKLLDDGKSGASSPGYRIRPGFAAIGGKGVYLWGGFSFVGGMKHFRDVWHWDGKGWHQVSKDAGPTVFDGSNGAWVPGTSSILAIGKKWPKLNVDNPRDETWEFNTKTNKWRQVTKSFFEPLARSNGVVMDGKRDRLLTLATEAPSFQIFYTWVKDPGQPWRKLKGGTGPVIQKFLSPSNARLVSIPALDLVLFHFNGGQGWETWLWDGTQWKQDRRSTEMPPLANMVLDPKRNRILAYGFRSGFDYSLWEWTSSKGWKLLVPKVTGIPKKKHVTPYMAFDPFRDKLILFYPQDPPKQSMFYEWDGKAWKVFQSSQFPNVPFPYLVYHPGLNGTLLFGGWDLKLRPGIVNNGKTWLWKDGKATQLPNAFLPETRSTEGGPIGGWLDPNRMELWAGYMQKVPTTLWKFRVGSLQTDRKSYRLGENVVFDVHFPAQANRPFVAFLSLGQSPMIPVMIRKYYGVRSLPLAPDALFQASMGFGLFTALSATGKGRITLGIPKDSRLLGLHLFGSGVTLGPQGVSDVADQVAFWISK